MDGRNYEAINYARVPGPPGSIAALAAGIPVVYGTFMPQRCYQEAASTGMVPKTTPEERSGQPGGGHCMLVVGYDLDRQTFLVRNSWGTAWGAQGYCEIPFEEMVYWSPPETFWCAVEMEPKGGQRFSVVSPPPPPDPAPAAQPGRSVLGTTAADLRASIGADLRADMSRRTQDIMDRMGQMRGSLERSDAAMRATGATDAAIPCNPCGGQGKCFNCEGSGAVMGAMCMSCRGSGTCGVCAGKGQTPATAAMPMRGAYAAGGDRPPICAICGGKRTCYQCGGSGVVDGNQCRVCYGGGRCSGCDGTGRY